MKLKKTCGLEVWKLKNSSLIKLFVTEINFYYCSARILVNIQRMTGKKYKENTFQHNLTKKRGTSRRFWIACIMTGTCKKNGEGIEI